MAVTMNLYMMVAAIPIAVIGIAILRIMAKKDPVMIKIYIRHIKFNKFYMSKPSIYRFL